MFKKIDVKTLDLNPFAAIGDQWMLITAGTKDRCNTMTASWGGMGVLWGEPVFFAFVRPQRYTFGFVEGNDYYSLCVFDETYRPALNFAGTKSGRDYDKDKETGLTPCYDEAAPYYEQARLVFICKKLYHQDLTADSFTDQETLDKVYPQRDLHRMFIGEIVKILEKI